MRRQATCATLALLVDPGSLRLTSDGRVRWTRDVVIKQAELRSLPARG